MFVAVRAQDRAALSPAGLHEDAERLERLIVKDYQNEAKTYREKLMQNHRVRKRIDDLQEASRKLVRRLAAAWATICACALPPPSAAAHTPGRHPWMAPLRPPMQLHIYEDEDGSRREEIADLGAASQAQLYT